MGDIDLKIKTKRTNRVSSALKKGLGEGLDEAGDWMRYKGWQKARDIIMGRGRVWNEEVKNSFDTSKSQFNRYNHWVGEIKNDAPHAEIVENGLAPAGEITGSTPSAQDILPWVDDNVTPNAAAQTSADAADLNNWEPDLKVLADKYGTAKVIAAFAIAEGLKDDGYEGIYFMDQTESYLESQTMNVKNKVEKNMNNKLREMGLK